MQMDLLDLSKRSGVIPSILLRAFRGGLDPVVFDFALFAGFKPRWRCFDSSIVEHDVADLMSTEIDTYFASCFGVVGENSPERPQGTGFR